MEFLSWHYTKGLDYYIKSWSRNLNWILHYFSLSLLLNTLFSPWKKLIVVDTSPGFNLQKKFEVFTFNIISRGIGATVRMILFLSGLVLILVVYLSGFVGLIIWLIFPVFDYGTYIKYKNQPQNFVLGLLDRIKINSKQPLREIFSSVAGQFVLAHCGLTLDDLVTHSQKVDLDFIKFAPQNFSEIVKHLTLDKKLWSEEYLNTKKLTTQDLLLSANWWDTSANDRNYIGSNFLGRPGIALELTFGYTPNLNQFSVDLSAPQSYSHRLIGRSDVVNRMERILASGNSIMLIGAPGIGKKTVLLEFAKKAANGQLGRAMSYKRVLEFDYNSFLSSSSDLNRKKSQLSEILMEAAYAGNIILAIRDIQRLTNADVEGYDFTDIFEGYLEKHELKIIAFSTSTDYERFISSNLRLRKYLERVEITPPSKEEALEILIEAADRWEGLTGLTILTPALRYILEQSDAYITEVPFPEKALEFLDAIVSYKQQSGGKVIDNDDVNFVLAEKTGISFSALTTTEKQKLGNIEKTIHERLIDQEFAVSLIGKALRSKTIGVVKEDRPLGSFLFLGPTGVGKTETAKVLAKVYYGSEDAIIRFDMAEYGGAEGLERLLGSVSKNIPGALSTAIKNKPASLLLLDEIEKASKDIYNLFLTLLDEGYITDSFGKKIKTSHLFVVCTSNAGAEYIRQLVNQGEKSVNLQDKVVNYVLENDIFSPEFINRFDGVVVYEPLREVDLVKIARLILSDLSDNLKKKNIEVKFSEDAIIKLAKDGYEPSLGARPMRRIVNLSIGDLIGKALIDGTIKEGDKVKIVATDKKSEFKLEK